MVSHPGFGALTGQAPRILLIFYGKRRFARMRGKWTDISEGLIFTYHEADVHYGIAQGPFRRAIDQLLASGFLTVKHAGSGMLGDPSVYDLSEAWRGYKPGNKPLAKRPRSPKIGFRGSKTNVHKRTLANVHKRTLGPKRQRSQTHVGKMAD
jgi:hypothetical protein